MNRMGVSINVKNQNLCDLDIGTTSIKVVVAECQRAIKHYWVAMKNQKKLSRGVIT